MDYQITFDWYAAMCSEHSCIADVDQWDWWEYGPEGLTLTERDVDPDFRPAIEMALAKDGLAFTVARDEQ